MTIDERIQKQDMTDGSLRFVLEPEGSGEIQAMATVSAAALEEAQSIFGMTQQEVESLLRDALVDFDAGLLQKNVLSDVKEEGTETLRFVAWYMYKDYSDIMFGVVHYDLRNSTTWPDDTPTVVRNKIRFETHKMLVSGSEAADKLLGVFNP